MKRGLVLMMLWAVALPSTSAAAGPRMRVSDGTAGPGTVVRISGRGFTPLRRAVVSFAGRRLRVVRTNARGRLHTSIRIPSRSPGVYAISARTGRRLARVRFRVLRPRLRTPAPATGEAPQPPPAPLWQVSPAPLLQAGGGSGSSEDGSGAVAPGMFRNPVWDAREFPDPTVIRVDSTYYAYGTGYGEYHQIMRSTDLVHWEWLREALEHKPDWVVADRQWHAWAPSVLPTQDACPGSSAPGCFILYYVGYSDNYNATAVNCVGVATSSTPEGPFADRGPLERQDGTRDGGWPMGCGDSAGHSNIDPQPYVDSDGQAWLYLSNESQCANGSCQYIPTISAVPLSANRLEASGARRPLLAARSGTWEQAPWGPQIENPYVLKRGDTYHLFYSGGNWQGVYAMGDATAPSAVGPFTRTSPNPWTGSTSTVANMGGGMPIRDGAGVEWLVYHGRDPNSSAGRTLRIDRLNWSADGLPRLDGPSTDARQAPTP